MVFEQSRAKFSEARLIGISALGHALCHTSILIFAGILLPMSNEFNLDLTTATGFGALSYLIFGIGALPAGWLTTKFSARLMLLVFYIGISLSSLLLFWSPNPQIFASGLFLLGLFASIYHVAGLSILSHFASRIGRAYGIQGIAGSIGIAGGPLLAGLFAAQFGWRFVYLLIAIPAFIGALFMIWDRSIPSQLPKTDTQKEHKQKSNNIVVFILFLAVMALNGFVYRAFVTVFPSFMAKAVHFKQISAVQTGGLLSALVFALGMIGQSVGGHLSDHINRGKLYLFILIIVFPFLWTLHLLSGVILVVVASIFSILYFQIQPVENSLIARLVPPRLVSSIFGLKFTVSFGVGSLGAIFVGWIGDRFNLRAVFTYIAPIAILSPVLTVIFLKINPNPAVLEPEKLS